MTASLASAITRAASKQTYYTIRFLVDRARVDDAYRAYAYFRWVDDVLDTEGCSGPVPSQAESLERQKSLLNQCLAGDAPRGVGVGVGVGENPQETMLVELLQREGDADSGLRAYLRNMMLVMDFDVRRRGKWISQVELNDYTRWLAIAVT